MLFISLRRWSLYNNLSAASRTAVYDQLPIQKPHPFFHVAQADAVTTSGLGVETSAFVTDPAVQRGGLTPRILDAVLHFGELCSPFINGTAATKQQCRAT